MSRHFVIVASNILFNNMIFINGFVPDYTAGGSLIILDASTVKIIECSFFSNFATRVGAIVIQRSISTMENVTMIGNKAVSNGGAVVQHNHFQYCNIL